MVEAECLDGFRVNGFAPFALTGNSTDMPEDIEVFEIGAKSELSASTL